MDGVSRPEESVEFVNEDVSVVCGVKRKEVSSS
jgi:hypothetical protein